MQFVYEAANCKRFYKPGYLRNITQQWADLAEVAWGSGTCVPGSTVDQGGKIGSSVVGYSDDFISKQLPYNGPGSLTNQAWKGLLTNMTGTDQTFASTTAPSQSPTPTPTGVQPSAAGALTVGAGWAVSFVAASIFVML